jgi:hypothetical protein
MIDSLLLALGEDAPCREKTASKTASCIKRDGSQVTGFVITDQFGSVGIIDKSAVRWLSAKEMWWLIHESPELGKPLE